LVYRFDMSLMNISVLMRHILYHLCCNFFHTCQLLSL
jgi:hypothetical protein